jgi:hypothetical protein
MPLSLTSSKAGNWVDRGASPLSTMQRVLEFFYDRHDAVDADWLRRVAEDVLGMVAADATDIQIAGYLKSVARTQSIEFPAKARLTSIALWHIAKAALVRDAATALLNSGLAAGEPPPPLSEWLARRLLTPAELVQFERDGRELPERD